MKFGIIGPGRIATKFANACSLVENAQVKGVASKSLERAQAFAEKFGIEGAFNSYEKLMKSDCEVVYIATTNNYHYENTKMCLENGKHVICEKPMTLSQAQTKELFDLAKQKGLFLMEAMWSVFLPSIQKAKELINSGVIGDVKQMDNCFCFFSEFDESNRVYSNELGGGALYDLGVYNLWISSFLTGELPAQINGVAEIAPTNIDSFACLSAKYANGSYASMRCGFTYNGDGQMTIYGTKGKIVLENLFINTRQVTLHLNDKAETFRFEFDNGFEYEIEEVIRCISKGKLSSNIATPEYSIAVAGIIDELLKSFSI